MEHIGTREIKTERLVLRRFKLDDAEMMYYNWANEERVTKFLSWTPYKNVDGVKLYISSIVESYKSDHVYHWIITLDGQAVGSISVVSMDEVNHSCEIGYCIGFDYWRKGITAEAAKSVIMFLFNEVKFHRIFAKHDVENPGSGRVMEKCGMQYEGTRRECCRRDDGTYSDLKVYSVIADV